MHRVRPDYLETAYITAADAEENMPADPGIIQRIPNLAVHDCYQ